MYIKRDLESKLRKYLPKKEIIAILGPRQSGKTTIMKKIAKDKDKINFITFEDVEMLELFQQDTKTFIKTQVEGYKYLFIDEFQYSHKRGKLLKYIWDTQKTKIIISGSSASELSLQGLKYLTGRVFIFNLYQLTFEEFLSYKNPKLKEIYSAKKISEVLIKKINELYQEYLVYGGYPRVVTSKTKEEKIEVLKGIYNTYLLKEVKEILDIKTDFKFTQLLNILAVNCTKQINYNEVSALTTLSYSELLEYLNILKKTFITFEANPFFTNKNKEIVKTPKLYFLDNGLRNYIVKNFSPINHRVDFGELNENFVAQEIKKQNLEVKYWRTKSKAEVDFVIESQGQMVPIEVKSNLTSKKISKSYRSFIEQYNPHIGYMLSYNINEKINIYKTKVEFVPVSKIKNIIDKFRI